MTKVETEDLLLALHVPRETIGQLKIFADMILAENCRQNLVSQSTTADISNRHIADSAQLVRLAPADATSWLDVGTGAGLPGVVNALMTQASHCFVEPRRLRAKFLRDVIARFDLAQRVVVEEKRVEAVQSRTWSIITARAFASLTRTIEATRHLSDGRTTWLLHKGRTAGRELEEAKFVIAADFEMIPSVTDPEAAIIKVTNLRIGNAK